MKRLRLPARGLLFATVLAGAAVFCWIAGRRGFFALDQSIPFDAGWRILTGQVPYRDFVLPVGPVLPWVAALGLRIFGADFGGYLASASALNALAAAGTMGVTARLFPGRWGLWAVAGGLTAAWFQAPAGTPWFEPVALLAALPGLGLWSVSAASGEHRAAAGAAAGTAFALAFLTKQNSLLAVAPVACLLLALEARVDGWGAAGRRAAWVAAGGIGTLALLLGWLALLPAAPQQPAPLRTFALHVLEVPGRLTPVRLVGRPWELARIPWTGAGPPVFRGVLLGLALLSLAWLLVHLLRRGRPAPDGAEGSARRRDGRRVAAAAALAAGLYWGGNLFALTTRNQAELAYGLTGLVVALGLGVAGEPFRKNDDRRLEVPGRLVRRGLAGLVVAVVAWRGANVALDRSVHEGVVGASCYAPVRAPALRPLRWAEPTTLRGATVERLTLERLLRHLEDRPGDFFTFPDWTILYGLVGQASPQPLLWFHPGLTYPRRPGPERSSLDRRIVAALEARRVQTVVLERASWLGTAARLADFPRLRDHVERCFPVERVVGPFEIRGRRKRCREALTPRRGYSTISRSSISKVRGPAGLPTSPS